MSDPNGITSIFQNAAVIRVNAVHVCNGIQLAISPTNDLTVDRTDISVDREDIRVDQTIN